MTIEHATLHESRGRADLLSSLSGQSRRLGILKEIMDLRFRAIEAGHPTALQKHEAEVALRNYEDVVEYCKHLRTILRIA